MAIDATESRRGSAVIRIKDTMMGLMEKIRRLNPGQRKILLGLVFFLVLNALILVISIIVFSRLLNEF